MKTRKITDEFEIIKLMVEETEELDSQSFYQEYNIHGCAFNNLLLRMSLKSVQFPLSKDSLEFQYLSLLLKNDLNYGYDFDLFKTGESYHDYLVYFNQILYKEDINSLPEDYLVFNVVPFIARYFLNKNRSKNSFSSISTVNGFKGLHPKHIRAIFCKMGLFAVIFRADSSHQQLRKIPPRVEEFLKWILENKLKTLDEIGTYQQWLARNKLEEKHDNNSDLEPDDIYGLAANLIDTFDDELVECTENPEVKAQNLLTKTYSLIQAKQQEIDSLIVSANQCILVLENISKAKKEKAKPHIDSLLKDFNAQEIIDMINERSHTRPSTEEYDDNW